MASVVQDDRRVWDRILGQLAKLRRTSVTVGVHADATVRDDGGSNAMIGAVHEFGTSRIPERSFLRATVDTDKTVITFAQQQAAKVAQGQETAAKAGERIGIMTADRVKRRIRSHIPPPLSPKTVERKLAKGSHGGGLASKAGDAAAPLIDSGQLINSINYEVHQ